MSWHLLSLWPKNRWIWSTLQWCLPIVMGSAVWLLFCNAFVLFMLIFNPIFQAFLAWFSVKVHLMPAFVPKVVSLMTQSIPRENRRWIICILVWLSLFQNTLSDWPQMTLDLISPYSPLVNVNISNIVIFLGIILETCFKIF